MSCTKVRLVIFVQTLIKPVGLKKRRILDLVEENYVFASVLHHFGIDFYDYQEQNLAEVCKKKGLKPELIIAGLEDVIEDDQEHLQYLIGLPVDLVIAYLKHKHFSFVKHTLPYLAKLINCYPSQGGCTVINDIKWLFPLFVEDFIQHMHEEEDTVFQHILQIEKALKGEVATSSLFFNLKKYSIKAIAHEHQAHDDVMIGIRKLTNDYEHEKDSPVLLKVIFSELQSFEKNLIIHSRIENEVLFPKALLMEKELYKVISKYSVLN